MAFYEIFLQFVPVTVMLGWLGRRMARRDVRLKKYVRRTEQGRVYRFVLFNADERDLTGGVVLSFEPLLAGAPITIDIDRGRAKKGEGLTVEAERLRALSTWIVRCTTDGKEADLRARLTVAGAAQETAQEADGEQAWAAGTSLGVTLLGILSYLGLVAAWKMNQHPDMQLGTGIAWVLGDAAIVLVPLLIAGSLAAFAMLRRWRRQAVLRTMAFGALAKKFFEREDVTSR